MKLALLVVGCLVALVVVIAIIGAMLPKEHIASRSERLKHSQADLWTACLKNVSDPQYKDLKLSVIERVEPVKLVTKIGDGLPFGGTWTYELATENGETVLTVTERGQVYNPIFRFVSRYVMGHTTTIDKFFATLNG